LRWDLFEREDLLEIVDVSNAGIPLLVSGLKLLVIVHWRQIIISDMPPVVRGLL
jgi:hypothetical protein